MRNILIGLFFFCISCISNHIKNDNSKTTSIEVDSSKKQLDEIREIEPAYWDTLFLGDINNDKINDTAFVFTPATIKILDNQGDLRFYFGCVENHCYNKIKFSCELPDITIESSVWGALDNIGDLNSDGYSELIFSPGWFTSCWGRLYIYSFNGKIWETNTNVSYRRCGEELLKSHVLKIKNKYYLQGTRWEEGDDADYNVQIKIK